jgi:CubicO group peptidase (beta-lactamase class C family)
MLITVPKSLMFAFFIILVNPMAFGQVPQRESSYNYKVPVQLNDGIATANMADAGFDSNKIIRLTNLILADTFTNIHSLLILHDNKLVYENYFPGKDEVWGLELGYIPHDFNSLHDVRSISKSIVSACIGIALGQKKINSIDDPIFNYLSEYQIFKTKANKDITIRNLLTMSSGIKWNEDTPHGTTKNDESQMEKSDDPVAYTLSLPMADKPGAVWNYNSGGVQVLAAIIKKVSGLDIDEFATLYLFGPLGIKDHQWIKMHKGFPAAASGLRLRSRDLLKIATLYLQKGKYNSKQVIPAKWIKKSFSNAILRDSNSKNNSYGYLFWIQKDKAAGKFHQIVSARGNGGERIFFDVKSKLIVVITSGNYNNPRVVNDGQVALLEYVLPALR